MEEKEFISSTPVKNAVDLIGELKDENLKLREALKATNGALNLSQAWITKIHDGIPDSELKRILAAGIEANAAQLETINALLK
jgi:hypothetical protein